MTTAPPTLALRIAHVVNSLTRASGVSYFCARLTQHLAEDGHQVDLYVWWIGDDALVPENKAVKLHETRHTGLKFTVRPDVIHIHSLWTGIGHQACRYARQNRIPYIVSPHGMLTPWALQQRWWKKLMAMMAFQYLDLARASALHATAQTEIADVRRLLLRGPVMVAPLGTDLISADSQRFGPGRHEAYPSQDSACGSRQVVLFLSRIHPKKGLANLIDAWIELVGDSRRETRQINLAPSIKRDDWVLVIAGPDHQGHKQELIKRAQSGGLRVLQLEAGSGPSVLSDGCKLADEADVIFTGAVYGEAKVNWHLRASLFVLPSHSENFGGVVVDSLACGVPVITTHGTPWAAVRGPTDDESSSLAEQPNWIDGPAERCGWWVPVGAAPLQRALHEAMTMNRIVLARMGQHGSDWIRSNYSWPAISRKVARVYGNLAGERHTPCSGQPSPTAR